MNRGDVFVAQDPAGHWYDCLVVWSGGPLLPTWPSRSSLHAAATTNPYTGKAGGRTNTSTVVSGSVGV